jgi:hypothetical protein
MEDEAPDNVSIKSETVSEFLSKLESTHIFDENNSLVLPYDGLN